MKINEAAQKFGLTPDTLRYYEKIGLLAPKRNASGIREYSEHDLERIGFLKCMRQAGLSIDFLVRYMKLLEEGDSTLEMRRELLEEQRAILTLKMQEMEETRKRLDFKIAHYDSLLGGCKK